MLERELLFARGWNCGWWHTARRLAVAASTGKVGRWRAGKRGNEPKRQTGSAGRPPPLRYINGRSPLGDQPKQRQSSSLPHARRSLRQKSRRWSVLSLLLCRVIPHLIFISTPSRLLRRVRGFSVRFRRRHSYLCSGPVNGGAYLLLCGCSVSRSLRVFTSRALDSFLNR